MKEVISFLSFSKRAAEEEKTVTVLESVLRLKPFFDSELGEELQGETEDGTRTTEKMRWAPIRISWSGWSITGIN